MAKRKINIQRSLGIKGSTTGQIRGQGAIDELTESMSSVDIGFRPTDQRVYEINLDRIMPDPSQPRRLLPHDLREAVHNKLMSPAEVMRELVLRAEQNDTIALLILGGKEKGPVNEDDPIIEDTGLLALAQSIREVGLRHPLNVYRIDDPHQPDQIYYRLGEGERRFWAHHLLIQQGNEQFSHVKCIVESLPQNEEIIHQRQEAENAARVDLPAIARARSMERIKDRLVIELGTRVPGENTIKLPSQRELQVSIGQQVKTFTGRAIGDRMVRNYLALLNLSPDAQDLAEAGQLTEKQLRPVMRLKTDEERLVTITRIINENWSGRQVLNELTIPVIKKATTLREMKQIPVEQKFEKRVIDAAKMMHALLTLPEDNYKEAIMSLIIRAKDDNIRQALQSLRQTLEEILLSVDGFAPPEVLDVSLVQCIPPVETLSHLLPKEKANLLHTDVFAGSQILDFLLHWQEEDAIVASKLQPFFGQVELIAESLRSGEFVEPPALERKKNDRYPEAFVFQFVSGGAIYWAHEMLVRRGDSRFNIMKAQIMDSDFTPDD